MFKFHKALVGGFPPVINFPSTASETYTLGEALKLTAGALTKCGATDKPEYICEEAYVAPASGNRNVRVHQVQDSYIYETKLTTNASTVKVGSVVTLHTDGATLTSTETSGVAKILSKDSDTAGAKALCKF